MSEKNNLETALTNFKEMQAALNDLTGLAEMAEEEGDETVVAEVMQQLEELKQQARRGELEAVAEVLRGTDIMIISDEIYSEMTYGGEKHVSIAEIDGMRERTIVVNGFSKTYAMTGWRLGYCAGPKPVMKQMLKLHQYCIMSSPTVSQYAAITALTQCRDDVDRMLEEYDMRRRLVVKGFNDMGLTCFEPEGAFYVFPCIKSTGMKSSEFCEKLIYSKKVAVVPGSAFGESGEGYVRVSYAYSVQHITTALQRIKEFVEELKK